MGLITKQGYILLGRLKPGSAPLHGGHRKFSRHDLEHFKFSNGVTYFVGNQDVEGLPPGTRNALQWVHQAEKGSTVCFKKGQGDRLFVKPTCPRGVWTPMTLYKHQCLVGQTFSL